MANALNYLALAKKGRLAELGEEPVGAIARTGILTCIQISQEGGQVVRHSHLLKNFPQFIVIHTVRFWHSQ